MPYQESQSSRGRVVGPSLAVAVAEAYQAVAQLVVYSWTVLVFHLAAAVHEAVCTAKIWPTRILVGDLLGSGTFQWVQRRAVRGAGRRSTDFSIVLDHNFRRGRTSMKRDHHLSVCL